MGAIFLSQPIMHYEGIIIRPPSEADSILLQVAVGCPHNGCTFCGTYKGELFRLKDEDIIRQDIDFARQHCTRLRRVFLTDGDVLSLPQAKLVDLFKRLRDELPWIKRISLYGSARSVNRKSADNLQELKNLGLSRVYLGLESGHDPTMKAIHKGATSEQMIEAGQKIRQSKIFLSVTALLGVAGRARSQAHAMATGQVLTAMAPNQIAVLTLMLLENTPLYRQQQAGDFQLPSQTGLLAELQTIIANTNLDRVQFQANHASNYLPINCRLNRDKESLLEKTKQAIAGEIPLKPEAMRAL